MGLVALSATALLGCGHGDVDTVGTTGTSGGTSGTSAKITATESPAAAGVPSAPRTIAWVDLDVGDCLAGVPPTDPSVITVSVVGCGSPHIAEVYFRGPVAVNRAVTNVADNVCDSALSQFTAHPVDRSRFAVTYLIDSSQDRTAANPDPSTVICLLQAADGGPVTGSARH